MMYLFSCFCLFSLAQFDIVITTYQIVAREGFKYCEDKELEKGKKDDVPKVTLITFLTLDLHL